jgi:DNA-binding NarL/FixJ family response regulator
MDTADKFKVLIVDDHPLFRRGLSEVIEASERFGVVAEAATGPEAVELVRQHKPEAVILDINLPGLNGFEVIAKLQANRFEGRLVILTMYNDEETFNKAINLGVTGYVLKENAAIEIISCLKAVAAGEPYVTPSLSKYLLQRRGGAKALSGAQPSLDDLTQAERRVLKLVAQGKTNKEIGELLFISPRTVESHRSRIRAKLTLKGDHGLLKFAVENQHAISQLAEE